MCYKIERYVSGRSTNLDSEKSRIRVVGGEGLNIVHKSMLVKNVPLNSTSLPIVSQNRLSNGQGQRVPMVSSFKGKGDVNVRRFGPVSNLTSNLPGLTSFSSLG